MNLYFTSNYPVAIKLNGIYFSSVYQDTLSVNVDKNAFVECCPLVNGEENVNFIFNDEFLSSPPNSLYLTDLKGGYLINLKRQNKCGFSSIAKETFSDVIVNAFNENGVKLSIETPRDFYAEDLPFLVDGIKAQKGFISNNRLLFIQLFGEKKVLLVFSYENQIKKLFCREIDDFNLLNNGFETTENILDVLKHSLTIFYKLENDEIVESSRQVNKKKQVDLSSINENLIPYLFLEEYLVCGDIEPYLHKDILDKKDILKEYLGDFFGVCPPPLFREQNQVGLVYLKSQNLFEVKYATFFISQKKITNLTILDD